VNTLAIKSELARSARDSDCFELGARRASNIEENDAYLAEKVDLVIAQLKRLTRTAGLEFALRVGSVIIHQFYCGDTRAWRSRGRKTLSFRRLSAHPELPLSPGMLYRCVAIFELCDRLNAPSRWEHLTTTHLRVVLGLPDSVQERLLATANTSRWTVQVLRREVARTRALRVTSGGRRASPPIELSLKNVKKSLERHRDTIKELDNLSSCDAERSFRLIDEARQCLDQLADSIRKRAATKGMSTD
jgi:hypothetical protein